MHEELEDRDSFPYKIIKTPLGVMSQGDYLEKAGLESEENLFFRKIWRELPKVSVKDMLKLKEEVMIGQTSGRMAAKKYLKEHKELYGDDPYAAFEIEEDIDSDELLVKTAIESKDKERQKEAIEKLFDQELLAKVLHNTTDCQLQILVLKKIESEQAIINFMRQGANSIIIPTAMEKITDQKILVQLAFEPDKTIRKNAIPKLDDQEIIKQIALTEKDRDIRIVALDALQDQKTLSDLALNSTDKELKVAAIGKVTDQNVLLHIVENIPEIDACIAAVKRLTNQETLAEIMRNELNEDVRKGALEAVHDPMLLCEIIFIDGNEDIRIGALNKIEDETILMNLIQNNLEAELCILAIKKIQTQNILEALLVENQKEFVRNAAFEQIVNLYTVPKFSLDHTKLVDKVWEALQKIAENNFPLLMSYFSPMFLHQFSSIENELYRGQITWNCFQKIMQKEKRFLFQYIPSCLAQSIIEQANIFNQQSSS